MPKVHEDDKETDKNKAEDSAQSLQLAHLTDDIETTKKRFDNAKIAAKLVVKSKDENVRSTAGPIMEELIEAFSDHKSKVEEYKVSSVYLKGSQAERKYAAAKYFSLDSQQVDKLKTQLSSLIAMAAWTKEVAAQKAAYARSVEEDAAYYAAKAKAAEKANDDVKAEASARYSITADAVEEVKNKPKALDESISKTFEDSINAKTNQINAEDSATETKIVLLADAMERKGTKFEDNSIKYPVDVGVEDVTMKAKVDEV